MTLNNILARIHISVANLCQWSVAIWPVISAVDVSQCSSSCDEWIDTDNNGTRGHAAKRDDQHTIHYHLW